MFRIPVEFNRPVPVTVTDDFLKSKVTSRVLHNNASLVGDGFVVPNNCVWYLRHCVFRWDTGAGAGNRFPVVFIWRPHPMGRYELGPAMHMLTLYWTNIWTMPASKTAYCIASPTEGNLDEATQADDTFIAHRTLPNIPLLPGDMLWSEIIDGIAGDTMESTVVVDEVTQ